MRRANLQRPLQGLAVSPLKAHAHLYELLRAELGVRLSAGRPAYSDLVAVRNEVRSVFTTAGYDRALIDRLLSMFDESLAVPTGSGDVSPAIGALFDEVLQLPCCRQQRM